MEVKKNELDSELSSTNELLEAATKALDGIALLLEHNDAQDVSGAIRTFATKWRPEAADCKNEQSPKEV